MLLPAVVSEIEHSGPGPVWKSGPLLSSLEVENQENLQKSSHRSDTRSS